MGPGQHESGGGRGEVGLGPPQWGGRSGGGEHQSQSGGRSWPTVTVEGVRWVHPDPTQQQWGKGRSGPPSPFGTGLTPLSPPPSPLFPAPHRCCVRPGLLFPPPCNRPASPHPQAQSFLTPPHIRPRPAPPLAPAPVWGSGPGPQLAERKREGRPRLGEQFLTGNWLVFLLVFFV